MILRAIAIGVRNLWRDLFPKVFCHLPIDQHEFLKVLSAFRNSVEWTVTKDGEIRTVRDKLCPVVFVCRMTTGKHYPADRWETAAYIMNYGSTLASAVVSATDRLDGYDPSLRKDLLFAAGLSQVAYEEGLISREELKEEWDKGITPNPQDSLDRDTARCIDALAAEIAALDEKHEPFLVEKSV